MSDNHENVRRRLLEAHHANEQGTWRIRGEDPNCDLGGHHHQPELDIVTGTYINVVEYALGLSGFFSWGGGGDIEKITSTKNIDNVINNPRIKKLEAERKQVEARLKAIDSELEILNRG